MSGDDAGGRQCMQELATRQRPHGRQGRRLRRSQQWQRAGDGCLANTVPKAIAERNWHVRFVPKADIAISAHRGVATLWGASQTSVRALQAVWTSLCGSAGRRLRFHKRQQVGIDSLCLRGRHTVWEALMGLQRAVLEKLCRQRPGIRIGHDLLVIAVHNQHRHGDLLKVLGEIGLRKAVVRRRKQAAHYALHRAGTHLLRRVTSLRNVLRKYASHFPGSPQRPTSRPLATS
jgi:hypothetical protein